MNRYPDHLVQQARQLAAKGFNYTEIADKLSVQNSTVSIWCRGINSSKRWKTLLNTNLAKRDKYLASESGFIRRMEMDKDICKLVCAVLYGCEGAKYPASNKLAITNSDENLIRIFINLMRKSFDLDESKWRVHLQIHTNQNYSELVNFWSSLLKIDSDKFIKPTITLPYGKKHRNIYNGTCTLRYYDYRLQLKLIGIYEEFMRKSPLEGGVA